MSYKLCKECGQPMLKKGQKREHPDDYRHASGCPVASDEPCDRCNYRVWVLSAETGGILYCAICDARDRHRDAATERDEARARIAALEAKLETAREGLKLAKKYGNFDPLSDQTIIAAINASLSETGKANDI